MEKLIEIVNLLNAATPGVAQLILMVKHTDGTVGVIGFLDEADAKFKENIKQAQDWLANNPKP